MVYDGDKGVDMGMDAYVIKPIVFENFYSILYKQLK